ncbi:hypothetical protein CTKA_02575 [Chthonomonas calidirosea]|uniref:DUF6968 domain-containing protein n=1 Tax=Chthonomonas calidirosea (strain DSM 23976 / ICMP 18418 / T49) TaxID=1303518 RepID=S0EYE0_CHTCT|nr:hypothetical protein [Chthonomonas calidirosea]CCW35341.1 hypothetical protein CCALI_01525 [Chthonomonas calidirosea T49]CEK20561.1 hypothetical protein CTKA_02575 [Chthonomonas calidirosea]
MTEETTPEKIASMDFVLRAKRGREKIPVTLCLGKPYKDEKSGWWECPYWIEPVWPPRQTRVGIGENAIEAIQHALYPLGLLICSSCRLYKVKLTKSDAATLYYQFPEAFESIFPEEAAEIKERQAEIERKSEERERHKAMRRGSLSEPLC